MEVVVKRGHGVIGVTIELAVSEQLVLSNTLDALRNSMDRTRVTSSEVVVDYDTLVKCMILLGKFTKDVITLGQAEENLFFKDAEEVVQNLGLYNDPDIVSTKEVPTNRPGAIPLANMEQSL